jgi:hypothetical protein
MRVIALEKPIAGGSRLFNRVLMHPESFKSLYRFIISSKTGLEIPFFFQIK